MTDIKFKIVVSENNDQIWLYNYGSGDHAMGGQIVAKNKTEAFIKTLHMFCLSIGPKNTTLYFSQDDQDLKEVMVSMIHETQFFLSNNPEMYFRDFESKVILSLFSLH